MTADSMASRLEELYVRHVPAALRLAYFLTGDRDVARDLVQDAFVRVAGRFRHLRQPDEFDAYLRRTIVNLHTSSLRRLKVERSSLAREAALTMPTANEDDHGARDEMWHAILGLPPRQRAAIVLRYYEDLSEADTAELLNCSVGTVKSQTSRALATLRGALTEESEGES